MRGACVVVPSANGCTADAWRRQEAAAKQLSLLPPSIDAAVNVLMTSKGLTADVDDHVAMKCWKCKGTGHIGRFCNKKPQSEAKKPEKKEKKEKEKKEKKETISSVKCCSGIMTKVEFVHLIFESVSF